MMTMTRLGPQLLLRHPDHRSSTADLFTTAVQLTEGPTFETLVRRLFRDCGAGTQAQCVGRLTMCWGRRCWLIGQLASKPRKAQSASEIASAWPMRRPAVTCPCKPYTNRLFGVHALVNVPSIHEGKRVVRYLRPVAGLLGSLSGAAVSCESSTRVESQAVRRRVEPVR